MGNHHRRFKQILINRKFQLNFLAIFACFIVGVSFSYGLVAYLSFHRVYEFGRHVGLVKGHGFFSFLEHQMFILFITFVFTFVVVLIIFLLVGLRLSHRIAGPIYRFNQHLIAMETRPKGEKLREVNFRDGDYFIEISDNFNQLVRREARDLESGDSNDGQE